MRKDPKVEIPRLKNLHNNKKIELGKKYFVSEWSWNPVCDGYIVCPEIIRHVQEIDGYKVYTTGKNYRHYFSWDIYDTEEQALEMTRLKDSYGYDWCKIEKLIDESKLIYTPDNVPYLSFEEIDFDSINPGDDVYVLLDDLELVFEEIKKRGLVDLKINFRGN